MDAVALLSGGIDSTTTMAIAKAEGYELYALSFDYGQRHKRELESAKRVSRSLGAKRHLIIRFDLREIGGSALTAEIEVPKAEMRDERRETGKNNSSSLVTRHSSLIPVTYVPARNTIFLSFALSWAEVLGVEDIFIGANALDYSGYPDCRPEYLKAFEKMANLATKASVEGNVRFRIMTPLIDLSKAKIIIRGMELGVDYSLTWSCYDPQPTNPPLPPFTKGGRGGIRHSKVIPCGKCDSCLFREKGFREAGVRDHLIIP
ncbi:MAG: 7-cyano-7-deazaguanine synthase QueC [Nitrospirota bacterium]